MPHMTLPGGKQQIFWEEVASRGDMRRLTSGYVKMRQIVSVSEPNRTIIPTFISYHRLDSYEHRFPGIIGLYRVFINTAIIQPHEESMHPIVTRSRRLADPGCASVTRVTLTRHNDHDWQPGKEFHR
jgi:hypothetical protein